jgi:deoxyribonuclease V
MKSAPLHSWQVDRTEALAIQKRLAQQVCTSGDVTSVSLVAGVDISKPDVAGIATAAVVVLQYPDMKLTEVQLIRGTPGFPYIPGLLSFREAPLIVAAAEKLTVTPDLILVDGQGIAHPRRFGIASHLGLLWAKPTIGCAKSRLCGEYQLPGSEPGDYSYLWDNGEIIGAVVRTRRDVKPVFISIGHKIDLSSAIRRALDCCRGYRLPEPTRLAHLAAAGNLQPEKV